MKKYIYSDTELKFLPYKERIGFWSRFTIGVLLTGCFISWFMLYTINTKKAATGKKAIDSATFGGEYHKEKQYRK